jgi:hypothetical protein
MRRALLSVIVLIGCGKAPSHGSGDDAGGVPTGDAPTVGDAPAGDSAPPVDTAPPIDAARPDTPPPPDAFPSVLDVRINCRNDCVLVANPASIAVPTGTKFEVNWINTGDTECDVAKIDQFNQVPIIIGLEPGTSYHDDVREWCGIFTGTFSFRVTICTLHSFIPVDCSAP